MLGDSVVYYPTTIVKLQKEYHLVRGLDPHIQSVASYLLLKNFYKIRERKEGRTAVPEWRRWLTFRNKYLRRQRRLSKGNLVCAYCEAEYLDPNKNNPFRKRNRKIATVDHILATSKGGSKYDEKNMCVCCDSCNNGKKDKDAEVFLKKKKGQKAPPVMKVASSLQASVLKPYPSIRGRDNNQLSLYAP